MARLTVGTPISVLVLIGGRELVDARPAPVCIKVLVYQVTRQWVRFVVPPNKAVQAARREREGIEWARGHDPETREALLAAYTLWATS